ncbi:MAG: hypothetical protein AAGA11_20090 [Pseudomonadota bacterium]
MRAALAHLFPIQLQQDTRMTTDSAQARDIKSALDELIHSAANSHLEILESLYHRDMTVHMLAPDNSLHTFDKPGFITQMQKTLETNGPPDSWAKYHTVDATAGRGHVLISRRVNLTGDEVSLITLSIDFVFEDGRWQIIREVIFTG